MWNDSTINSLKQKMQESTFRKNSIIPEEMAGELNISKTEDEEEEKKKRKRRRIAAILISSLCGCSLLTALCVGLGVGLSKASTTTSPISCQTDYYLDSVTKSCRENIFLV